MLANPADSLAALGPGGSIWLAGPPDSLCGAEA